MSSDISEQSSTSLLQPDSKNLKYTEAKNCNKYFCWGEQMNTRALELAKTNSRAKTCKGEELAEPNA